MTAGLAPPPINSPQGSYYWIEWYTQLTNILNGTGYPWTALNFTNSNLHDIITRHHNSLLQIQGGNAVGDVGGTGNAWHMTGRGYVNSSGTGTGLPGGWSVAHTSTGVYTLTHNLNLQAPAIGALATSATSGVLVQWIDNTNLNTTIFHLTTSGGSAADGAFTFLISS